MSEAKRNNEALTNLINQYDTLLPFNRYLTMMMPEYDFADGISFKICCPLHEEKTPSFSYSHNLDLWTCFGQCHTSGKTVRFHYLWLQKQYGEENVTIMRAIQDLYRRFSHILPNPNEVLGSTRDSYNRTVDENGNVVYKRANEREKRMAIRNRLLENINAKPKSLTIVPQLTLEEEILKLFITNVD